MDCNYQEKSALSDLISETARTVLSARRILIAAPSYQFLTKDYRIDHERRERALRNLEALGMVPSLMGRALEQKGRFAGSDQERAADFESALLDRQADLVMALRGGYGMTRLLPLLDWERIKESRLPMIGFSDFTAFNLALWTKTGRASWHGPMLGSFAKPEAYTLERFSRVFGADAGPIEWEAEPKLYGKFDGGAVRGPLWGGNLCLLASLVGTEWFPKSDRFSGGILFLEDVGEYAYRVERMLLTLLDSGILASQKAVLLGHFTNADDSVRFEGDQNLKDVVDYLRSRLPERIPILSGLPLGHVPQMASIPVGVPGVLRVEDDRAALDWELVP